MGRVFSATDTRLSADRAIKLLSLPDELSDEQRISLGGRLTQEARASMTLSDETHHVVRVFDVGESEDGQPFLVMELLKGETLTESLQDGAMDHSRALKIARQIAEALACAHRSGMIHRDLKPDNVMLIERGDDSDFVKLLDFGLVKMDNADVRTQTGIAIGTFQYMSPEQLRGQQPDPRMDVFAFGCVLYEMLSGVRANPGTSQPELFAVLLDKGVAPIASLKSGLDEALMRFVDECVQLDPELRPADGQALVQALDELSSSEIGPGGTSASARPLSAIPTQSISPSPDGVGDPQSQRSLAVPILLLIMVCVLIAWWSTSPEPTTPSPDRSRNASISKNLEVTKRPTATPPKATPPSAATTPPKQDSATLSSELPSEPTYKAEAGPAGWIYSGASDDDAFAGFVLDLVLGPQTPDRRESWSKLPESVRYWLSLHFESMRPTAGTAKMQIGLSSLGTMRRRLKGPMVLPRLGTIWSSPSHGVIFESVNCRQLRAGDVLVTAKWSVRGYGKNDCERAACADALARILKQGTRMAEEVRLKLNVERSESDSGKTKPTLANCTIKP